MHRKRAVQCAIGVIALVLLCLLVREVYLMRKGYQSVRIENSEEVAEKIRTGLGHRAYKLHITFRAHTDNEEVIKSLVDDLIEKALYESDDPTGGDYIRYQLGGYQMNYSVDRTFLAYKYKMELMPTYYSTRDQEAYVDTEVARILEELQAQDKTEEEKVRIVHDYVTELLSYDSVHKDNRNSHGKTTAYAALRYHQAVCQGYTVLSYRLLKELGVRCRIVTGDAEVNGIRERHAWLKVNVDGSEWYVDPTLDDVGGCYDWFMKTEDAFSKDHWPED